MKPKTHRNDDRRQREQSGDEQGTNLIKRLADNQPLSDTHEIREGRLGDQRKYRTHGVEATNADEHDDTRGSNG